MGQRPLGELLAELAHAEAQAEQIRSSLGPTLRATRVAHGLSQQQLADSTGIAQAYISQIENGVRSLTTTSADRILDALTTEGGTNANQDIQQLAQTHLQQARNQDPEGDAR